MITDLFAVGLAIAVLIAFARWRAAIFLVIVFGTLQDPIRKLTPETPAIMAVTAIPIWCAACLAAFRKERMGSEFQRAWPRLARLMKLFLISLVPATLLVFQYGLQAWRMAAIGLFGYLVPMASVLAGFVYPTERNDVRRVLVFYCVFTGIVMSGSFMEYAGVMPDWAALGTGALDAHWIRYMGQEQIDLVSGFYRSPDVMGWHAAALTMFAMTLQLDGRGRRSRLWAVLAAAGMLALIIGGRRKMMAMPVLWCAFLLLSFLRTGRASRLVASLVVVAATAGVFYFTVGDAGIRETYYVYAASTPGEASERLLQDTFGAVVSTFSISGPLGRGIGSASQGTQHIGLDEARGWQESGLSKLAVELGVAGLVCAVVLMLAVARGCLAMLRSVEQRAGATILHYSLFGFLLANGMAFLVSHQVYGDPLVMVLTAFAIGVVLSPRRWQASSAEAPAPAPLAARAHAAYR